MTKRFKQALCVILALIIMLSGAPSAVLSYATENDANSTNAVENNNNEVESPKADQDAEETAGENQSPSDTEYPSFAVENNNEVELPKADQDAEETAEGNQSPSDTEYPSFSESAKIDGVTIEVNAPEGVFPANASLYVDTVSNSAQKKIDEAVENERSENKNVASSYTYDIKAFDVDGNEIQPTDGNSVYISFSLDEVADSELNTHVYHVKEEGKKLKAEALSVVTDGDKATVETDGFSYYTVEFTYGDKQYVLEGGGVIKLDDLLAAIGIEGKVKGVSVSAPELFNVVLGSADGPRYMHTYIPSAMTKKQAGQDEEKTGNVEGNLIAVNDPNGTVRWVASYQPFTTEEWMDVLMEDGTSHHIIVTDALMAEGKVDRNVPGLYQGENLTNFAPLIPVADVWIDASKFATGNKNVNGDWNEFIPGELMANPETSPFQQEYPDGQGQSKASNYTGRHFVYYDSTKQALNGTKGTERISDGVTVYQSYNYFPGVVGTYKWEDAAVRMLPDGSVEYLDVYVEYANPLITLQPLDDAGMTDDSTTAEQNSADITDPANVTKWNNVYVGLFGGNAVTAGGKTTDKKGISERYGLRIDARPYVKDKAGNLLEGAKVYFPMADIDVRKEGSGFVGFYQGNSLLDNQDPLLTGYIDSDPSKPRIRYSEAVRVEEEGLVFNSDGYSMYIPGSDGSYKANIFYDATSKSYAVQASSASGDPDPGTFNTGFLALIKNGKFKVNITSSGGNGVNSVITYVMSGGEYNYRLRHSTETLKPDGTSETDGTKGGTIQTTREGNHNGELNDGQLIDPSMIATAVGQTIVYTMTPKPGYALKDLYVWNDPDKADFSFPSIADMDSYTKISEGNGANNTYEAHDDDGDGIIDRYTYSFTGIHADNAIHAVWVKTALDIRKSVTGSGAKNDTFTFTIKAWGDADGDGQKDDFVDFTDATTMGTLASRFTSIGGGLYRFTLDSYETISIAPGVIPFDFQYEVEEIQVGGKYGTLDGWTPSSATFQSGKLTTENPFGKANFVNKRKKATDPDETLTIKKIWEEDVSNIRPRNATMYIQEKAVGVNCGSGNPSGIRATMAELFGDLDKMRAQMTAFKYGTKAQADAAAAAGITRELPRKYGDTPVYVWKEGTELYIYSDASIYLVGSLQSLFFNCRKLTDISGLAYVRTDYVTSTFQMFSGCVTLADFNPLAKWNTASVTNMGVMFQNSAMSDLGPLQDWETRNVTSMRGMFSGTSVSDLSKLAGWDVTRVTTMASMFSSTNAAQQAQIAIAAGWDPGVCTNFGNMFQNSNGGIAIIDAQLSNLPVFAKRSGVWDIGGNYTGVAATHTDGQVEANPPSANESRFFSEGGRILSERAHDVDENDPSGNTWIYEFDVPLGSFWKAWEVLPDSYAPYYTLSNTTYKDATGMTTDLGAGVGTLDNPTSVATPKSVTTFTNTRNKHELRIKKDSSPATNEKFTFTLKMWSINESNRYDLPDNHPKLSNGSIKRVSKGIYEFTLIPSGVEELELPAGIRYSVTEAPVHGWSLVSERNTNGLLNRDKEASFINAKNDALKVVKTWENDNDNLAIMKNRPTGSNALGIKVITQDKSTRWKQIGQSVLTDIVGTPEEQAAFYAVQSLYEAASLIPELKESDGTTDIPTFAPKKVYVDTAIGTLLAVGDYVVDAVEGNSGQFTVYPVENVPFIHTYTNPDYFLENDGAGNWLYEFNIPKGDEILSVEETTIPPYYRKTDDTTVNSNGEVIYNITNSLDVRDLEIKKETIDDEPGIFQYGIKFWFDNDTSHRHPIKVGHSQFIMDKDGEGNEFHEYELFFENGVTYGNKDVAGLNEMINEELTGKLTKAEAKAILATMQNLSEHSDTMVGDVDSDFTRYHRTTLTLADLGIKWNGQDAAIYVEQDASLVKDMFTSGRRLDWFIIPTPGQGEEISVRKPYALREQSTSRNGFTYPKQVPDGVTGADGTYYFTLKNGEKIVFNDLPVGVSYEVVETKQLGWDLIETRNTTGNMLQKNDNSGNIEERWNYKGTTYTTHSAAEAVAVAAVAESTVGGVTEYTNNAVYTNKDDAVNAAIIMNHDNTWKYEGIDYQTYDAVTTKIVTEVNNGKNVDNTYSYAGNTYYTRGAMENIARSAVVDNGNDTYTYGSVTGTQTEAETAAIGDISEYVNVSGKKVFKFGSTEYLKDEQADIDAVGDVVKNGDGTYTFGSVTGTQAQAEAAAHAAVIDNQDNTYEYKGKIYPSAADAEAAALKTVTANNDNTYTVDMVKYPTLAAAKTAAEGLVEPTGTGSNTKYKLPAKYASKYDAEKAAKAAITKEPYEPREALFKNEREKGTIKVKKETVSNDEGTFTFRMMTGRVVKKGDVKDKNGNPLAITRIYPKDPQNPSETQTSRTVNVTDVDVHTTHTEFTTEDGNVYKMTDEIGPGNTEIRKVYKKGPQDADFTEISTFNVVYPREFTDMSGMNYKFTTTSGGTETKLNIETTTFEFKLKNDEFATIANIPYGSRDRIWEVSDADGNLIEDGWELVAIDGDIGNTQFQIDGVTYDGIDAVMETTHTVEHSFLNDRKKVDLTIKKLATGNQGSRDQYFKFKIDIENAGDRTFHLDMTNATTTFGSGVDGTKAPNSATSYTRNVILNGYESEGGNTRDDAPSITYENASVSQRRSCEWEWTEGGAAYRSKWNSSAGWITYKDNSTTVGIEPPKTARRVTQRSQHINTDAASGKATIYVYLQHNQSATLKDLPIGSKYEVREIDPTGYRTSTAITGPYTFNGTAYTTQAAAEAAAIATITQSGGKYVFDGKDYTTEESAKAAARTAILPDVLTGENWNSDMLIVGGSAITTGEKKLLYDGMHVEDSFIQKDTEVTFTNNRSGAVPTEVRVPMVLGGLLLILASLEWLILRYRKRRREAYYEE